MAKKYVSFIKENDKIYEMIYNKEENLTQFVTMKNGEAEYLEKVEQYGEIMFPYPPSNNILKSGLVLFSSKVIDYKNDKILIEKIKTFIHKYLELSEFFEEITPYYVLFTWIYDNFKELPYLRAIGDTGCGKSRFIKVIGSICYKPTFTSGAVTTAPIFRMIDEYNGTLIIDEADMKYSEADADLVKILNCGYQTGIPVIRCGDGKDSFNPIPFQVFGPKLLASRNSFKDDALENRCLLEKMRGLKRKDIVFNLDDSFEIEAQELRNMLLCWRLKNYGKRKGKQEIYSDSVEPRLNQIIFPLTSVIDDVEILESLKTHIKSYNQEMTDTRGMTTEATILQIIIQFIYANITEFTVRDVTNKYNGNKFKDDKTLTYRKVGDIIRNKLGLKNQRKNFGYIIDIEHAKKEIPNICRKYGFTSEEVNQVNFFRPSNDSNGNCGINT